MVPVVSHIFDVSSSMGLGIESCRTCWKDEYGNHTLGMKAQNMHQLRVLGLNNKPSNSCHLGCGFLIHLSNRSDSPRFRAPWKKIRQKYGTQQEPSLFKGHPFSY